MIKTEIESYVRTRLDSRSFPDAIISASVDVDAQSLDISVSVEATMPTSMLKLAGIDSIDLSASARAKADMSADVCALALDETSRDTIQFQGSGTIDAPDCFFWSNSDAESYSMRMQGSGSAVAQGFCAVGDVLVQNFEVNVAPRSNCTALDDPLENWTPPTMPKECDHGIDDRGRTVGYSVTGSVGTTVMYPGKYCGDVKINVGNVDMRPGDYFFDGGKVTITTQDHVVGDGVYIHFGSGVSSYKITAGARLELTSRYESQYESIVLYKEPAGNNRRNGQKSQLTGTSHIHLSGVVYTPADDFLLSGSSEASMAAPDTMLIANRIEVQGNGTLRIEPDPDFREDTSYMRRVWLEY